MDLSEFRHKYQLRVRSFEIDSQGIVHNSIYLQYLEVGRIEYRRSYGYKLLKSGMFDDGLKVVVVNNSIDYKGFAYLDEVLNIYTKISCIKNSSFYFHQVIEKESDKSIVCEGRGVLVNLDPVSNTPATLPNEFVNEIRNFEKDLVVERE